MTKKKSEINKTNIFSDWRTTWIIPAQVNNAGMSVPRYIEDMMTLFYSWKHKTVPFRKVPRTFFYNFLLGLANSSSMLDHIFRPERNKYLALLSFMLHVSRVLITGKTFTFHFVGSEIPPIQLQELEKCLSLWPPTMAHLRQGTQSWNSQ